MNPVRNCLFKEATYLIHMRNPVRNCLFKEATCLIHMMNPVRNCLFKEATYLIHMRNPVRNCLFKEATYLIQMRNPVCNCLFKEPTYLIMRNPYVTAYSRRHNNYRPEESCMYVQAYSRTLYSDLIHKGLKESYTLLYMRNPRPVRNCLILGSLQTLYTWGILQVCNCLFKQHTHEISCTYVRNCLFKEPAYLIHNKIKEILYNIEPTYLNITLYSVFNLYTWDPKFYLLGS